MNVLIAGSREVPLKEREDIYEDMRMVLSNLRERHEEIILVSGGARGIDRLGEEAAASLNIDIKQFLPSWDVYGRRAGMVRNRTLVEKCDIAFIYWDGSSSGTANTISLLRKANKPHYIHIMN